MTGKGIKRALFITLISLLLSGCDNASLPLASVTGDRVPSKDFSSYVSGDYDSFDTAVIAAIDTLSDEITLYNYDINKFYTLNFDGTSSFADRYKTPVSLSQLSVGDLVDVWFMKDKRLIAGMCEASETFTESDITDFEINTWSKTLKIKSDTYRVSTKTFVSSDGKKIDISELSQSDNITIRGIDNTVMSITVDNGHGYIMLEGNDPDALAADAERVKRVIGESISCGR